MDFNIILKPSSIEDLENVIDWYNSKKNKLGFECYQEVEQHFEILKSNPLLFQKRYKDVRILFTKRFHLGIHYTIEGTTIYVHAILSERQDSELT